MAGNCLRTANNEIVTSEWEDVQYKFGNKVGKYATQEEEIRRQKMMTDMIEEALDNYDPLEHRTLEELDEMLEQDGKNDEDEDALVAYRNQRRKEMLENQKQARFGSIRHITKSEYVSEVSEASKDIWVICLLVEERHPGSEKLLRLMSDVAARHSTIKFVSIKSTDAIANFPPSHLPTALIYHNQELVKQMTGLESWGGKSIDVDDIELKLKRVGPLRGARTAEREEEDEEEEEEKERGPAASGVCGRMGGRSKFSLI